MSVYKRTVRGRRTRNYYIDYEDEEGRRRTVSSGTSDKRLAERIKWRHVDRVRAIREGLVDPAQERLRAEADKPLRQHVDDYVAACRGRGEARSGLREKARHLEWFLAAVGEVSLTVIRPDDFDLRLAGLSEDGLSARTVNLKLECARAFLNWCVKNGRLRINPLTVIQRRNQLIDRRRLRRVLIPKETRRLLAVARKQSLATPSARTRPLWYLFPLLAGLRRSDMVRLCWRDVDLHAKPPTLTICGGKARRRTDRLPLHAELVGELRAVRPGKVLPSALVFPRPVTNKTRRRDFERAGIVLETEDGHADLHALRHTFGTLLAKAGVPPAKLQRLMRHTTVELTMRYYVHLRVEDLDDGLRALPYIEDSEPLLATEAHDSLPSL